MTEDYVSFETAKLLKERGFDEACLTIYGTEGFMKEEKNWFNHNMKAKYAVAPTQALVIKWLRVKYNLYVQSPTLYIYRNKTKYEVRIFQKPFRSSDFKTPEEATEEAIQYCLKNLIK